MEHMAAFPVSDIRIANGKPAAATPISRPKRQLKRQAGGFGFNLMLYPYTKLVFDVTHPSPH